MPVGEAMGHNNRSNLRVAIPALSLLICSSFLVVGAQRPGQLPIDVDSSPRVVTIEAEGDTSQGTVEEISQRIVNDADCTFLQDPRAFIEDRELHNAIRTSEMNRV